MVRSAPTRYAYASQAIYGALLYGVGSIATFYRAEQELSYVATSAFPAALWVGAGVGAGLSPRLLTRVAQLHLLRISCLGIVVGAALIAVPHRGSAIAGLGVVGAAGGVVLVVNGVLLIQRYGEGAGRTLLEANVLTAGMGTLSSGLFAVSAAVASWRMALLLPIITAGVLVLRPPASPAGTPFAEEPDPAPSSSQGWARTAALLFAAVTVCAAVLEFTVVQWVSELVGETTGSSSAARWALVVFTAGLFAGRCGGIAVATDMRSSHRLLVASLVIAGTGSAGLVAASTPWTSYAVLAITGLGVASLYPVAFASAVAAAGDRAARVGGLTTATVSAAVLGAPVLLGLVADAVGLRSAFLSVPLLAVVASASAVVARRQVAGGTVRSGSDVAGADPGSS